MHLNMIGTCLPSWNAATEEDIEDGPDNSSVVMVMVRHYCAYRSTKNTTTKNSHLCVKSYQKHIENE